MPRVTKAEPRNAWEDTYFPPASEADVPVPVNEHVYTTTDKPYTFRLDMAETEAFKAWCAARKLKHGPVIAAALREYMARHGEG